MKSIYLTTVLLLVFFCSVAKVHAQHSYSFVATTGTYTELTNPAVISWQTFDSLGGFYNLNQLNGESFIWYNVPFVLGGNKTFSIQPNGNLRFDNDSSLIIVDAAFTYLDSIDSNSSVSYVIDGIAGNYVVKAQWKNLKIRVGQAINFVNFQIWVYQQTGVIEIHYGTSSTNNQSGFNTVSGPQVGLFYSPDNFSMCYEKLWLNGSPSVYTLDSAANFTFNAMSGISVSGTIFRFLPRFLTTGIQQLFVTESAETFLFPNPIKNGTIYLARPCDFQIIDLYGKFVAKGNNQQTISVNELAAGIYFLKQTNGSAVKFVIE